MGASSGNGGVFSTFIGSLGYPGLRLKKPFPVTVFPEEGGYTASFMDANLSTCGETAQEAVNALQELVAEVFLMHVESGDEPRSPTMRQQRVVLVDFVCRTSPRIKQKQS